jgi:PAS domain S-box-containing protein
MRIRTLLQAFLSVAILMVLGLTIASWFISEKLARVSRAEEHAQAVAHDVSELIARTQEYALYSEDRAAQQWKALHARIVVNLEVSAQGAIPLPREALREAALLPDMFQQLVRAMLHPGELQNRQKNLLLSQLQASSQTLAEQVHSWGSALVSQHRKTERTFRLLAIIIPSLMLLILTQITFLLNVRVLTPLSKLLQAVRATARGDLTVRSATGTRDEFGELSSTFDAMAIDLVCELQQEIFERKRAEQDRIRAEEALRESQYFFEETQRSAHIGSYKTDFLAGYWESSEVLDDIFGIDKEYDRSIPGWLGIVHPDDREMMEQYLMTEVVPKRIPFSKEYRIIRKQDDQVRWVSGLGEVKFGASGEILAMYGTIQDITERRKLEEERGALEQQLRQVQKLESLGVLAGGIAHDFNNILMAITGNADLALMRIDQTSPARENLVQIGKAAIRAADLARQMLAYSGKGRFSVESIDLNEMLEDMLHLLEISISKKAVLRLKLQGELPPVEADATQIRQIVMNLIINASEAIGDASGVIAISTGALECTRAYLKDVWLDEKIQEGSYLFLEVSDNGCGMDPETLARLFDPFFTTKFTGRGLGMAAVLGIIRGHKGAIKVNSEAGKGTTFKVLLPVSGRAPARAREAVGSEGWRGSGIVLLADDEATVRGIGKEMLQELGFTVVTANDGREAVELFKATTEVAFVVLDLTMPVMDGEQCFRELRQHSPEVKVVLSSGYHEQEVARQFAGRGVAGFIQKPYDLSTLREALRKIL